MNGMFLYLLLKLDSLRGCFENLSWTCGILGVVILSAYFISKAILYDDEDSQGSKYTQTVCKKFLFVPFLAFVFAIMCALTPSTKQMAIIYVVPKVVNSQSALEIPKKLLALSNEWLEELRPKSVKEGNLKLATHVRAHAQKMHDWHIKKLPDRQKEE